MARNGRASIDKQLTSWLLFGRPGVAKMNPDSLPFAFALWCGMELIMFVVRHG
jgi:hypothetical protein